MSDQSITYTIKFDSNGNAVMDNISVAATKLQKTSDAHKASAISFGASFLKLNAVKRAIEGFGQGFKNLMKPGIELGSSLSGLAVITITTVQKQNELGGYALKAAKTFGCSAAQSIEAFKLILYKLEPDIAIGPDELVSMRDSVSTLSKPTCAAGRFILFA